MTPRGSPWGVAIQGRSPDGSALSRWERRFNALQTYAYWRGLRDSVGSLKGLRALRWTAPPSITQKIDDARPLAPQVERLNIDETSRLVVMYQHEPLGSIQLHPSNLEPLLPWLVREITGRLSRELLLQVARAGLLRGTGEALSVSQFIEAV